MASDIHASGRPTRKTRPCNRTAVAQAVRRSAPDGIGQGRAATRSCGCVMRSARTATRTRVGIRGMAMRVRARIIGLHVSVDDSGAYRKAVL